MPLQLVWAIDMEGRTDKERMARLGINIAGRSAERILGRSVRPVLTLRGRIHTTAQDTRKRALYGIW